MNKCNVLTIGAIVAAVLISTGCATNQANQNAGIGAAAGCASGAILAIAMGGKAAAGCAGGAVAGALIGYMDGRQKDLQLAEQTRQAILSSSRGTDTEVAVYKRNEAVPENERAKGSTAKSFEAVDKMVVQVPNTLVAKHDERAAHTFGRVGNYVSTANTRSTVTINARNSDEYEYIRTKIRGGYSKNTPEPDKVSYVYTELKRGSQASVEVAHV